MCCGRLCTAALFCGFWADTAGLLWLLTCSGPLRNMGANIRIQLRPVKQSLWFWPSSPERQRAHRQKPKGLRGAEPSPVLAKQGQEHPPPPGPGRAQPRPGRKPWGQASQDCSPSQTGVTPAGSPWGFCGHTLGRLWLVWYRPHYWKQLCTC